MNCGSAPKRKSSNPPALEQTEPCKPQPPKPILVCATRCAHSARNSPEYHRKFGETEIYPEEFVDALTREGWLAAIIPEEYGGSGLGLTEASIVIEEVNRCGGNAGHCHGQV